MAFRYTQAFAIIISFFLVSEAHGQHRFFSDAAENSFFNPAQRRVIVPLKYRTLVLDKAGLFSFLPSVPNEKNITDRSLAKVIEIPLPEGGTARFRIWETPIMESALAAQYPDIKTYTGQGIDDPTANIKIDWTMFGFHAMILSSLNGAVFIDPFARGNTINYMVYNKTDFKKNLPYMELPPLTGSQLAGKPQSPGSTLAGICIGAQLRTYRLALAATGEYTAFQGGTVAQAQAAQVTTMSRVNGVYEREVAIRMVLVNNNNALIYVDGATDPYTNDNGSTMRGQNQHIVDSTIGTANYDIGHVFSTFGGGVAYIRSVCNASIKAGGVTGSGAPVGDPFDIDFVAHEMGHQFGGNHPFNSVDGACNGNGSIIANAEPGSGSTIMAYAGICNADDLQPNSDAQFHTVNFDEIAAYTNTGGGNSCAVITATGNLPPVVNAGADYTIPRSTPFILTGSATDPNGDPLTYSWEQADVGGPFGPWNNPSGNAPLFRSFVPQSTPVRFFPKLSDVINNTTTKGELLPSYARTMHFRLTARDNRGGGGGVCYDASAVSVDAASGPFVVTSPNAAGITWFANDFQTITWDPAGTAAAPVSCANVSLQLSLDGGNTFPVTILASTPNDGTEEIQVPNNLTTLARFRVMATANVFYDISNFNSTIQNSPVTEFVFNHPPVVAVCSATSGSTTLKTSGLNGFSTPINLSVSGTPAGTTLVLGSNLLTPGAGTTVTLNNTGSLAAGFYDITITGVAGSVTKTRVITFLVGAGGTPPSSLSKPGNGDTGVSITPNFIWTASPGAVSYTLEIATSSSFTPLTQTINNITSASTGLITPLAENTVYYWRVKSSKGCGTGAFSAASIFKTGIATCGNSTDVPQAIPDSGVVTSTFTIPVAAGVTISDLNVVNLVGTHSYISDIKVTLTSPLGTTVTLFDGICGSDADFNLNFDDEATSNVFQCPPTVNQAVIPLDLLSAFDGENSAGTWTLTIKDNFPGDAGELTGWGLTINSCAFIATPLIIIPAWTQICPPAGGTTLNCNITGAIYQWQQNTGSGFVNITNNANFSGANTISLQISNAPTSWAGYQFRCLADGVNSNVFTLGFADYFTGTSGTAWENPANWSCNALPDANTDVIINSGVIVNSNGICRSLKVTPGKSVTVNTSFKITITH